ncbi:MAG: Fic family protein [Eggerthellaceae bacterium]|nr:Fic family protein [Eggerthellaceae bacterium]
MFAPKPIAHQEFLLSGNTQSRIAQAEIALARIDERLRTSPIGKALKISLARLEAISTIRIAGCSPDYETLLSIECQYGMYLQANKQGTMYDFLQLHPEFGEAEVETFKYLQTLLWLTATVVPGEPFEFDLMLDMHSLCLHGAPAKQTGSRFRKYDYQVPEEKAAHRLYRPASPDEIDALIEDLYQFVNTESYAPTAQAALAHFQFECIKPFKNGLDRTGRAMCHAIMYRRGAFQNCIPPIALMPALQTIEHTKLLLPYDMGVEIEGHERLRRIDEWTWFCGYSTELAAQMIGAYVDAFESLEQHWREKLGKFNKGSAMEMMLPLLIGTPVITVSLAMAETGRSFSAVNDAINRLAEKGILEVSAIGHERTRIFTAREVVDALEDFIHDLSKQLPIARDKIYRKADGTLSVEEDKATSV